MDFDDARTARHLPGQRRPRPGGGGGRGAGASAAAGSGIVGLLLALLLGRQPGRPRAAGAPTARRRTAATQRRPTSTQRVPDRRRRRPRRGLPRRRRRQQRAGLLGRRGARATSRRRRAVQPARPPPAAAAPPPRSARSTARPTRASTSTSASSTSCARQYGAQGGDFAQAYVIAHEYGHHVQNLTGASERRSSSGDREGPQSGGGPPGAAGRLLRRRLGRQRRRAPASSRSTTPTSTRACRPPPPSATTGSRRSPAGRVDPESWTHGSAEQRQKWFRTGLSTGDPRRLRHLLRRRPHSAPPLMISEASGTCGAEPESAGKPVDQEGSWGRDVEAERPQLVAAVVGDLVRAPRRHPDPVDPHVVDQRARARCGSGPR